MSEQTLFMSTYTKKHCAPSLILYCFGQHSLGQRMFQFEVG